MPRGAMRRKDREMTAAETEECLARAMVGRIGTIGPDGMPYVVPMNFAYDPARRTLFFHCATSGHLLENLAHNRSACFEVDEAGSLVASGPQPCDISQLYRSVICFGQAYIVLEENEKERALRTLISKYGRREMLDRSSPLSKIASTTVIALRVEIMTGKERRP